MPEWETVTVGGYSQFKGRFLCFRYHTYYPGGGLSDVFDDADTKEDAMAKIESADYADYFEILDRETGESWSLERRPK